MSRHLSLLSELQKEMGSLLGRRPIFPTDSDDTGTVINEWIPLVDIKEENNRFILQAELPGIDPKDIEIEMENGILTIKGEKFTESEKQSEDYARIERYSGKFYRRFSLPDTADGKGISAKAKHGVLEVIIPKAKKSKQKKIKIQDGE